MSTLNPSYSLLLKFVKLLVFLTVISVSDSYRILGIFPHAGRSHFDVFEPLFLELAKRGHDVTVIGYFPQEPPVANYNDVSLVGTTTVLKDIISFGMIGGGNSGIVAKMRHMFELAYFTGHVCETSLKSQELKDFIERREKFDLVLTEFFTPNCLVGLMHFTGGSLIGLTSSVIMPWINDFMANPDHPAYIPSVYIGTSDKLSFFERVLNFAFYFHTRGVYEVLMNAPANDKAKEIFDTNLPELDEFAYNTSLVLVNSHHSLHLPRPLVPGVIEVGGMHIGKTKELPAIYTPKLWYFKKLEFLNDHVSLRQATSSFDPYNVITNDCNISSQTSSNFQEVEEYLVQDDRTLLSSPTSTPVPSPQSDMPKSKKKKTNIDYQEILQQQASTALLSISQAAASFKKNELQEDEDVLYGKYVATRLKNIKSLTDKLEIKHKIDQLLFEAQMTEFN